MSLYNKYRPTSFEEMKGDYSRIEKVLKKEDHNHVFLFEGPSGCGKTTAARIFAGMVGAYETDIQERNCSNATGIDDMRKIIEEIPLSPFGKAKIYILDEFQNVSSQAQNALLKELEDVPGHVYFALCTSDSRKVIPTIKTRAVLVNFPPLTEDDIYDILRDIKTKEGFGVTKDTLFAIAENAQGSARKAINTLESIGQLDQEEQEKVLAQAGSIDSAEVIDLCRTFFSDKPTWRDLRMQLQALEKNNVDSEAIRRALLGYGKSILLGQNNNDTVAMLMDRIKENTYDTGFPGVVSMIYLAWAAMQRGF